MTAIDFHICCSVPNFIKIGSRVRPPDAHNCLMFNAQLLGNGRYHGNRIMADMSETRFDATTQVQSKSVHNTRLIAFSTFSNMARPFAILNFTYFHIWSRNCNWVPNLLLYRPTIFHQNWITRSASRRSQTASAYMTRWPAVFTNIYAMCNKKGDDKIQ